MIQIEKDNGRVKWHQIKAEYVSGISQRALAAKYKISREAISKHCMKEGWTEERKKAQAEVTQMVIQKTAETAADNAIIAERIKTKLLRKLEREIDNLPDLIGSETRNSAMENEYTKGEKGKLLPLRSKEISKSYKLRDLTAAYKDLIADMQLPDTNVNPLLQSLYDLERRCDGD